MEENLERLQNLKDEDYENPIEIIKDVFWVGSIIPKDDFQCHPYLLLNGKNSVLFDPGSMITFPETFRKIEEIIPFTHIRYFVCHHQDPDITGALPLIDNMVIRKDALIISHWRAIALLKHLGLKLPFKCVEEMNWSLDLDNGKSLTFIFSPYLHFPGAFVSYIKNDKILLSSDIFGAISKHHDLIAKDESCYEGIRLFHEHYMPSREILLNFLFKMDALEIDMILPQHGSVIPKKLIPFVINRLKEIECGIYTLTQTSTEIIKLSRLNKLLTDITKTIILSSDFNQIVQSLLVQTGELLHIENLSFISKLDDGELIFFGPDIRESQKQLEGIDIFKRSFGLDSTSWKSKYGSHIVVMEMALGKKVILREDQNTLLVPLYSMDDDKIIGFIHISLEKNNQVDMDALNTLNQLIPTLSAALERELIKVRLDKEKKHFYQVSIKDSLTGLYTRFYMEEMAERFCKMQDRDPHYKVIIIYYDIDDFKSVNDRFGHSIGDKVLIKVSEVILNQTRREDIQVRLGGEELGIIILSQEWEKCYELADRIRLLISELDFSQYMGDRTITISGGMAIRKKGEEIKKVFEMADKNLYKAKSSGKNKIVASL